MNLEILTAKLELKNELKCDECYIKKIMILMLVYFFD